MNLSGGCIGNREGSCLAMLIAVTSSAFLEGGRSAYRSGNQHWLAVVTGAALSLAVFLLAAQAMQRRSCADLHALYVDVFGGVLAIPFAVLTALLLIVAAGLPLVRMLYTLRRFIFVDADADQILIYLFFSCLCLALLGFETLGRTAKLFAFPVLLAFLLMILLGLPDYDLYRLYPLPGSDGTAFLWQTGICVLSFLPPLLLLLVCCRGLHGVRNVRRIGCGATAVAAIVSLLLQLAIGSAFSFMQLSRIDVPVYQLLLSVRGGMLLRLDKILLFVWLIGMMIAAAALVYGASFQICSSFGIRDIRPVGSVCVVLCSTLVLLGNRSASVLTPILTVLLRFSGIALLALVLLSVMISFLKKERRLCESAV